MVKVRALRYDGSWAVSKIPFITYLYGKWNIAFSQEFRNGAKMISLKLIFPWQEKNLR